MGSVFIPVTLKVRKKNPDHVIEEIGEKYSWEEFGFNLANMSHWRGYVDEDEEGKPLLYTMLYMQGNSKGIVLGCKNQDFVDACVKAMNEGSN